MPDTLSGLLTEVIVVEDGSTAVAASAVGATTITLDNSADYTDGTVIQLADDTTAYTVVGDPSDDDVITVTPGLVTQVSDGDPVRIILGGSIAANTYAIVDLGGAGTDDSPGDTVRIPITDQAQQAVYPEGQYDPPIPVTVSADLTAITGTPGSRVPQTLDDISAAAAALQDDVDTLTTDVGAKAEVTVDSTAPTSPASGDLWYDTSSTPAVAKVWDGAAWQPADSAAQAAASAASAAASAAQTLAGSKAKATIGTAAPSGPAEGDIWVNTISSPPAVETWHSGAWVVTGDPTARSAVTALPKLTKATTSPIGNGVNEGDEWKQYADATYSSLIAQWVWDGSTWQQSYIAYEVLAEIIQGKTVQTGDPLTTGSVVVMSSGGIWDPTAIAFGYTNCDWSASPGKWQPGQVKGTGLRAGSTQADWPQLLMFSPYRAYNSSNATTNPGPRQPAQLGLYGIPGGNESQATLLATFIDLIGGGNVGSGSPSAPTIRIGSAGRPLPNAPSVLSTLAQLILIEAAAIDLNGPVAVGGNLTVSGNAHIEGVVTGITEAWTGANSSAPSDTSVTHVVTGWTQETTAGLFTFPGTAGAWQAAIAGWYTIAASLELPALGTSVGRISLGVLVNNEANPRIIVGQAYDNYLQGISINAVIHLAAGDYFRLVWSQNSGSTQTITQGHMFASLAG